MFVCLLDELMLGFCYNDLTLETGGFELASTIILVLLVNRLTKRASHLVKCDNSSIVETGISDHNSLICTTLLSTFCKGPAKFIYYKCHNNYNKEQFENVLKQRLASSSNFEEFFDTFLVTLNEPAPLKKKKKSIQSSSLYE